MKLLILAGLPVLFAGATFAQDVISAKAGTVHYTEGDVFIDGKAAVRKLAEFPVLKNDQELRTELGRAEVLLAPGVFLRVAENSGVRMRKNALEDTKLELTAGSVLVETGEVEKGEALYLTVGNTVLDLSKKGLYRVDFSPAQVKVHDGTAVVTTDGQQVTVKEGRMASLTGAMATDKFNKETGDAFFRWAKRRSGDIALANITAAKRAQDNGHTWFRNGWAYNPYFGMFTYLPLNGMYHSPWGYSFYSPFTISRVYYVPQIGNGYMGGGGGGFGAGAGISAGRAAMDMGGRGSYSGGYSAGTSVAAPAAPAASAPAPAASAGRGAGGGSSHGGGGR